MRDLAGLDLLVPFFESVLASLESSIDVSRLLREKVDRGQLGVKSGQGFHTWTPQSAAALQERIGRALVEMARLH
jgi:3-hydroxybutyryl-CoA dehydrogenase